MREGIFFFKQKTAYEMRISDWSSDVCSSDLATMLGCPDLRDEARHSVSEHKEIDDKLGELVQTDMDSSSWMEAFGELQHRYLHHIEEEEEEMFPKASEGLTSEAEERIAKIFERRKPRELQRATQEMPGDERE